MDLYNTDRLRPVIYSHFLTGKPNIGVIAHELQEHYPFLVEGNKDDHQYQSVNYTGLIGVLIKEIQELKKRNTELSETTKTHDEKIKALENQIVLIQSNQNVKNKRK